MTPAQVPAEGLFDTITGLPMHPLVVHVAVVLLPVAALLLILIVLIPRWRRPLGWLTMIGLFVGTGAAFVAKESGEALAARVGEPEDHAELGDLLPMLAVILFVVALLWFLLDRRRTAAGASAGAGVLILGIAGIVLAVATIGLTIAVGHSGAEATWAGVANRSSGGGDSDEGGASGDGNETTEGAGIASPADTSPASFTFVPAAKTYTRAQVRKHNTATDCWTIVGRGVYNLTSWVNRHPGGASRIIAMCGRDATTAFNNQHAGQSRPMSYLASFRIGRVAAPTST